MTARLISCRTVRASFWLAVEGKRLTPFFLRQAHALPQIDAYHLRQRGWRGVRGVDGQRHQEIKAVLSSIVPEFSPADLCPVLEPGRMASIVLIGQDHSPGERQHTHQASGFEGIVAFVDIGDGGRDVVRRLGPAP